MLVLGLIGTIILSSEIDAMKKFTETLISELSWSSYGTESVVFIRKTRREPWDIVYTLNLSSEWVSSKVIDCELSIRIVELSSTNSGGLLLINDTSLGEYGL